MIRKASLQKLLLASALIFTCQSLQAQSYKKIHKDAILVDTHNDVLINVLEGLSLEDDLTGKTHSDLARFKKGGVDVQFFSIWSDGSYGKGKGFKFANQQIDSVYAIAARNPDKMVVVTNYKEIMDAVKQNKLAAMIGVEGGHMIEDDLSKLDSLYKRGARYLTLTWNNSTSWASSAADEVANKVPNPDAGLNELGKDVVKRMNQLGMMVDISHVGEQTFKDVLATTTKPVIASHSSVYSICDHHRNLKDEQIKAIAKNGGVIQLNFAGDFIDCKLPARLDNFIATHQSEVDSLKQQGRQMGSIISYFREKYPTQMQEMMPPLSALFDHMEHIIKLVGVAHVGLGSDFDGITFTPQQLNGVEDYPNITKELVARGYSKKDINKILGGNLLRVLRANEKK